nr:peroxisomal fatty acid beta-oxidation multifunctional protein AIM1-like [Ipomoea batatas]
MGSNSTPVAMEIGSDGIAVITLSNPPVNALTLSVIAELKQCYQEAMERDDVKGVVLTGTGGKFCGGLDIDIIRKIHKTGDISYLPDSSVDLIMNTIENAKSPTVLPLGFAPWWGLGKFGCYEDRELKKSVFEEIEKSVLLIVSLGNKNPYCLMKLEQGQIPKIEILEHTFQESRRFTKIFARGKAPKSVTDQDILEMMLSRHKKAGPVIEEGKVVRASTWVLLCPWDENSFKTYELIHSSI